ncbi:MAG: DUF2505 domain-containing protein [Dermatophilaceae bacterium]
MHITERYELPAPPDKVFAMLTDEEFVARKCAAQHAIRHSGTVHRHGDGAKVVAHRELPTGGFPDFAKALVGHTIHVTETVEWSPARSDGTRTGKLTVHMGAAPIGVHGTITLAPGGAGSVITYSGDLKARVPFIGGRVENAAKPTLVAGIHKERDTGADWLAE